ncbi:MAG: tetratricopeptide repeat protein, partial [Planctomyces sp.]
SLPSPVPSGLGEEAEIIPVGFTEEAAEQHSTEVTTSEHAAEKSDQAPNTLADQSQNSGSEAHSTNQGSSDHSADHAPVASNPFVGESNESQAGSQKSEPVPVSTVDHGSDKHRTNKADEKADDKASLTTTRYIANQMDQADEDLRSGSFERAISRYQALESRTTGESNLGLAFRLALCAETMGSYAEAIDSYQRLGARAAGRNWGGIATFGEARCLVSMERHEALRGDLLRRTLTDESAFTATLRKELFHLLGRSQWSSLLPKEKPDLLNDLTPALPEWHPESHVTLDSLKTLLKAEPPKVEPLQLTILEAAEKLPDEILLKIHSATASPEKLLAAIVSHCQFELNASESARSAMESRSAKIHVTSRSLALILDALTIPYGNLWQLDGSKIELLAAEEAGDEATREFRVNAAERLLRTALLESPESVQAGHTRVSLGALLFQQGLTADAAHLFQQQAAISEDNSVAAEAAFNLAKCRLALHQAEDARTAFLLCVDSADADSEVRLAGYLYAGRLRIELGRVQDAITTLMHALSMSDGTDMEPQAAMTLASAYLMAENAHGANSVLKERRTALMAPEYRNPAAFLSSLSRFRAAVLPDKKEREGRSVVEAMVHLNPEKQFGAHWCLLAGDAADELGLAQQATDAYLMVLQLQPAKPMRDQTLLKLATRFQADNRLEDAHLLLTAVTPQESESI